MKVSQGQDRGPTAAQAEDILSREVKWSEGCAVCLGKHYDDLY